MPSARVAARREATRDEIITAAWNLARSEGLSGLGMRELAAEVGMSAPSLYDYFPSKDAILDAMFVQGNEALIAGAQAAVSQVPQGVRAFLISTATFFVEFCNEDPARFQLMFQHAIPGWRPSAEAYAVAVEVLQSLRAQLIDHGITSSDDLDLWTAITTGLASQQVANDPGGDRWIRLIEPTVDMYLASRGPS